MSLLVIFHGNCADGFGAAWAVWKHVPTAEFYAGVYQDPPPSNVEGRDLLFVDFCYKRPVMLELAKKARSLLVLDHHKSAMEDMRVEAKDQLFHVDPASPEINWETYAEALHPEIGSIDDHTIHCMFDMNRSGAGLTWDFFNPGKPRPLIVNFLEDRDLWRFQYPDTRPVQAAMFSLPYDFRIWNHEIKMFEESPDYRKRVIEQGEAIERKHFKDIEELIRVATRPMRFALRMNSDGKPFETMTVPVANLPYTMTSDAGHVLCERDYWGKPYANDGAARPLITFAATYYDTPKGRQFSLRSQPGGADVSAIAALYGGGGHARAAGFRVPFHRLPEFEP